MTGQSDWHVHPGEILREWREENGVTPKMLSRLTGGEEHDGFTVEDVERLEAGEITLSAEDCDRLARGTGITAVVWRNLQIAAGGLGS